jgi:hypothetical protein
VRLRDGDSCAGQAGIAWGPGSPPSYLSGVFGASDSTIFSKRGSPRSGSQTGNSFKAPYARASKETRSYVNVRGKSMQP